jgi:CheY-like chemotaxis protein
MHVARYFIIFVFPIDYMNNASILIADDDADDRYLLETAFVEKGYQEKIQFVENGVEVLNYLAGIRSREDKEKLYPRFVLLDLNMPKKDGREVLREMKENPDFKRIPVIVFTTTKNENEIRRCYELGANTYIIKPVSFDGLLSVVENIRAYWMNTASIPA